MASAEATVALVPSKPDAAKPHVAGTGGFAVLGGVPEACKPPGTSAHARSPPVSVDHQRTPSEHSPLPL
jgi:hypothetical protein